jgi:MFS family permease
VRGLIEKVAPARFGSTFRWLLASSWVSSLGDGFSLAAGPLLIASRTHNPVLVSLAAFMQWVPGFAFGLYAGALADRVDRRLLVLVMSVVRVIAIAALTAAILTHVATVVVVLAALFVLGLADTFVNSASGAILPMVVAKPDLGVANARFTFGWVSLSQLAGPPIGAALFAVGAASPASCCSRGSFYRPTVGPKPIGVSCARRSLRACAGRGTARRCGRSSSRS